MVILCIVSLVRMVSTFWSQSEEKHSKFLLVLKAVTTPFSVSYHPSLGSYVGAVGGELNGCNQTKVIQAKRRPKNNFALSFLFIGPHIRYFCSAPWAEEGSHVQKLQVFSQAEYEAKIELFRDQ